MIAAPGQAAKWQLLRTRFQKAIAEGASTSQVTAISVLASIYLQAVIAASMEEVELFLAPLTARSKVREVLRGLVATRQVHTISLGHAPHFYVAGTLPEFAPVSTMYASSSMPASAYFLRSYERDEEAPSPAISLPFAHSAHAGRDHAHAPGTVQHAPASTMPAQSITFRGHRFAGRQPMERQNPHGRTSAVRPRNGTTASPQSSASPAGSNGRPARRMSDRHGPVIGAASRRQRRAPTASRSRTVSNRSPAMPANGARWNGAKNGKSNGTPRFGARHQRNADSERRPRASPAATAHTATANQPALHGPSATATARA